MRKIFNLYACVLIFCTSGCSWFDLDNYNEPDCTVYGTLIDEATGKNLQSQQPNGFRIRLKEYSWSDEPTPIDFWGKADGTFQNQRIFTGEYGVQPFDGAFIQPEEQRVTVKNKTEVTFTVKPYVYITDVSYTPPVLDPNPESGFEKSYKMTVSYKIAKPNGISNKIYDTYVFFARSEHVGLSGNDATLSKRIDLNSVSDQEILGTTYTQTITKLPSGKTYYFRIAARTNATGRYNYSDLYEVKIP